jgi:DNA polymerase-3 subunit epsilon
MDISNPVLKDMDVLVLDCQATQSNPDRGFLLEMGWMEIRGRENLKAGALSGGAETFLIQIPAGRTIPPAVRRVTGLKEDDFRSAVSEQDAWNRLAEIAYRIAQANELIACPTVIHYARYETPLLRRLYETSNTDQRDTDAHEFPLEIICTHEIVRNLLPHLPRKSLRAVAGYFGCSVPENRRSRHHVPATAMIWHQILDILEEECGISEYADLKQWLGDFRRNPKNIRSKKRYPLDPELRLGLPDAAGVYRMLRSNGDTVYVGKAKSLRRRVNSYFQKRKHHQEYLPEMLTQVRFVDVSVTGSALEAALLESDEIKRLSPPYNRALQAKGRKPVFYSRDFRDYSEKPGKSFLLGPLPDRDALKPVFLLGQALKGNSQTLSDLHASSDALGMHWGFAPEPGLFRDGLEALRQKYGEVLSRYEDRWESAVVVLGRSLWTERLEHESRDEAGDEEKQDLDSADGGREHEWTTEKVLAAAENVIYRSAHLLRRSRWLCILSESSLAWEHSGMEGDLLNVLVIEQGGILLRKTQAVQEEIPFPPGYGRSSVQRRRCFDLMTYDRMRVLLSEMRRIIAEGRQIQVRLNPRVTLHGDVLRGVLAWL